MSSFQKEFFCKVTSTILIPIFKKRLLTVRLISSLFILGTILLFFTPTLETSAIKSDNAIEISKTVSDVQVLLNQYPSTSYAIVTSIEWKEVECWKVMWWTQEHLEAELYYPNLIIYIGKDSGKIFDVLIPRGFGEEYAFPESITIKTSKEIIDIDQKEEVQLSGSMQPPLIATIKLEYSLDGKEWYLISNIASEEDGSYSYTWQPSLGIYSIRGETLSATSEVLSVQAIPEFGGITFILTIFIILVATNTILRARRLY